MEKDYKTPQEALKALKELEEANKIEDLVKDNKIHFTVRDEHFRLHIPNQEEQLAISDARRKKKLEFMDDPSYRTRSEWIVKYKEKGIDIEEMEKKVKKLQADIESSMLKLAQISDAKVVGEIKEEIKKLQEEQIEESVKITNYLADSLEDQLRIFVNSYTAYLVLEKKEKDNWIKYFKNYEELNKSGDNELIISLFYYYDYLIYGRQ